jgi:hypothetical protein
MTLVCNQCNHCNRFPEGRGGPFANVRSVDLAPSPPWTRTHGGSLRADGAPTPSRSGYSGYNGCIRLCTPTERPKRFENKALGTPYGTRLAARTTAYRACSEGMRFTVPLVTDQRVASWAFVSKGLRAPLSAGCLRSGSTADGLSLTNGRKHAIMATVTYKSFLEAACPRPTGPSFYRRGLPGPPRKQTARRG